MSGLEIVNSKNFAAQIINEDTKLRIKPTRSQYYIQPGEKYSVDLASFSKRKINATVTIQTRNGILYNEMHVVEPDGIETIGPFTFSDLTNIYVQASVADPIYNASFTLVNPFQGFAASAA